MADLKSRVSGITFPNPVLTAAGPNVGTSARLLEAARGGAGGIVTKTVSVVPAKDPRPTIRKGPCGGLINCETWSEIPVEECLEGYRAVKRAGLPLILSIVYSPEDVKTVGRLLEREADPDAFEFSTHYTGRSPEPLLETARALRGAVEKPIWMKLSPGTSGISELAAKASEFVDGFVAMNSMGPALDFDPELARPALGSSWGQGWLSGPALLPFALGMVFQVSSAQKKPVIGAGGISSGVDAVKFIMAGASLVQVCTAAILEGAFAYGRIASELDKWLSDHGFASPEEIRGLYGRNAAKRSRTMD